MDPARLDQFIGQDSARHILRVMIHASRMTGRPVGHILLYGPPGLGKTTLARIIASEMGNSSVELSGPTTTKPKLFNVLLIKRPSTIILDEAHSLDREVAEVLYPAMDDSMVIVSSAIPLAIVPFTLIGITTEPALIPRPLESRFQAKIHLDYYSSDELAQIVSRTAPEHGIVLDWESALEIGRRSRGTPRVAKQLLTVVANFAVANRVEKPGCDDVLRWLRAVVDDLGLTILERKYLQVLVTKFQGGPVGLNTIASSLGESPRTIVEAERYLLRLGLIQITTSGREITDEGFVRLAGMVGEFRG